MNYSITGQQRTDGGGGVKRIVRTYYTTSAHWCEPRVGNWGGGSCDLQKFAEFLAHSMS